MRTNLRFKAKKAPGLIKKKFEATYLTGFFRQTSFRIGYRAKRQIVDFLQQIKSILC